MICLNPKASRESGASLVLGEDVDAYEPVAKRLMKLVRYWGKSYGKHTSVNDTTSPTNKGIRADTLASNTCLTTLPI
jgi:hypothetical protein